MPWLETDVRDQRIQFVMAARRSGANRAALCRAFGISRKTAYKWLAREAAAGSVAVLGDRSRRPHCSPTRMPEEVTQRVIALREEFGWGGEKLACLLAAEGAAVSARTIDRIIRREGLTRADTAPAAALRRFERAAPNDLWQMDMKGAYPLAPSGRCHPLSILDDHSRFAVGLYPLPSLHAHGVRVALVQCFEQYGVPRAMLMDHGSPWWATSSRDGLTGLSVFLLKQGIDLIHGAVRHPQTQGKVERFHRTLGERLRWHGVPESLAGFTRALAAFRVEYNELRPHEALGMRPPAHRFARSPRGYHPETRPWEYPSGLDVRRVQHGGSIHYGGHCYFVSEALRGEEVGCEPWENRVLVHYRHMYVRELHPRSRRSVPLMRPAAGPWPADAEASTDLHVLPMS